MSAAVPPHPLPPDSSGVRCLEFRALGTDCRIKFREPDPRRALQFAAAALDWTSRFEAKFSRFRPDSVIARINEAAGRSWVDIDSETEQLLDIADGMFRLTSGILDSTLLPLAKVWDWKVVPAALPDAHRVDQALRLTGWDKVQRRPGGVFLPEVGMGLDFGGFGKELAVDAIARLAANAHISDFLVDLGRDVFASGGNGLLPCWHIGIEDGTAPGTCWGQLALSGRAVSSSGNYARKFSHEGVNYGHILDPRTGWPVRHDMEAVTVVADTCLEAGIYSTAVFVLGTQQGLALAARAKGVAVCAQSHHGITGSRGFHQWLAPAA